MRKGWYYPYVSAYDGGACVAIVVGRSENRKTHGMVSISYMRADIDPRDAAREGADASVCGTCLYRPICGGGCYVRIEEGPLAAWRAVHDGRREPLIGADLGSYAGRMVRDGAYGDAASMSRVDHDRMMSILQPSRVLAYTHGAARARHLRGYAMASCGISDVATWRRRGWATFSAAPVDIGARRAVSDLRAHGISAMVCRSETSGRTCAACGVCTGARPISVVITAHGRDRGMVTTL